MSMSYPLKHTDPGFLLKSPPSNKRRVGAKSFWWGRISSYSDSQNAEESFWDPWCVTILGVWQLGLRDNLAVPPWRDLFEKALLITASRGPSKTGPLKKPRYGPFSTKHMQTQNSCRHKTFAQETPLSKWSKHWPKWSVTSGKSKT